jgi:hypothetical protein
MVLRVHLKRWCVALNVVLAITVLGVYLRIRAHPLDLLMQGPGVVYRRETQKNATMDIHDATSPPVLTVTGSQNASITKLGVGVMHKVGALHRGHRRPTKPRLRGWAKRFPTVMIVGFGKAGTRALFDALKMHPDLRGPTTERRFFSDHYKKGLLHYLMSLPEPPKGGYIIEKSPDYIIDEPVPSRIISALDELGVHVGVMKFIVVLRDPVDRAMSEYLEWQASRHNSGMKELPPFDAMVLNPNGSINIKQPFLDSSRYSKYIKHWYQFFKRTQTCFVDGDRFTKDPFSEVHLLEECLNLRPHFTPEHFVYEQKRGFYCFKASTSQENSLCMGNGKGRRHPAIPKNLLAALHRHYQPFDDQLLSLTGRSMQWLQKNGSTSGWNASQPLQQH